MVAGQIQVSPLTYEQMQQLINNSTTAILSFLTTDNDTHIFILRQNQKHQLHTCPGQGLENIQNFILYDWLKPYLQGEENNAKWKKWQNKMGVFLETLCQRLQLNKLISNYLNGIEELIIVPHIYLHQIPFSALPISTQADSLSPTPNNPEKRFKYALGKD